MQTSDPQPAPAYRHESLGPGRTPGNRTHPRSAPRSRPRWPALVRDRAADSRPLLGPDSPIDTPEAEVYQLGELCAQAYMQSEALHFRALLLLAEFHRLEGWKSTSFPSTAEWLAWRVGINLGPSTRGA